MTRSERLKRCYFQEETDRPCVYSRTGFPQNDPTYDKLKSYLREHSELKQSWPSNKLESQYKITEKTEPHSEDFKRIIYTLSTPAGDLQRTALSSLKNQPGLHETFFLKNREDAEKYLSLPLPELGGDVSSFFTTQKEMGDQGIVQASIGRNPGSIAAELFGSEMFAMMTVTDRDIIHTICEREMKIILNRVKFLLENKIGPYFSMLGEEYIVPPLHGRDDFYDFNVKYDKPIIDLIHEGGGRIHIHSHGSIKKVFQGFIDMGADILHPFEGPPMGDITPAEAKTMSKEKICLEGNIQIHRMYEANPEEIKAETENLINDVYDSSQQLIVSPTASPYLRGQGEICFPQYKAMIDTVLEYNR